MPRERMLLFRRLVGSALIVSVAAACGGDSTAAVVSNPRPTLLGVTPSILNAGSAATTVRLSGQSFVFGSRVFLDGTVRAARFVNSDALDVDLSANDLAAMDTLQFVVVN